MTTTITEDELRAEMNKLDELRINKPLLTEEQYQLVKYARRGNPPITWVVLAGWWKEKYRESIKESTLKNRFRTEQLKRGER